MGMSSAYGQDFTPSGVGAGSQQDLEQRLSAVRPMDSMRGIFFNGVLSAVRAEGDARLWKKCVEAAGNDRFMDVFTYPVGALLKLLYTAAWGLSEKYGGFEEALRHLGRQMSPDFMQSAAGRMMLALAGMDAKRLISILPAGYRASVHHGECIVEWTGPRSSVVRLKDNLIPCWYYEGSLRETLGAGRLPGVEVKGKDLGTSGCELAVSW
jgi:uncharacterized protein (TIGR02265 family)